MLTPTCSPSLHSPPSRSCALAGLAACGGDTPGEETAVGFGDLGRRPSPATSARSPRSTVRRARRQRDRGRGRRSRVTAPCRGRATRCSPTSRSPTAAPGDRVRATTRPGAPAEQRDRPSPWRRCRARSTRRSTGHDASAAGSLIAIRPRTALGEPRHPAARARPRRRPRLRLRPARGRARSTAPRARAEPPADAPKVVERTATSTGLDFSDAPEAGPTKLAGHPAHRGRRATPSSRARPITVNYFGQVYGGDKPFDKCYARRRAHLLPARPVRSIEGWVQGLVGARSAAASCSSIPPELGYGEQGQGEDIPGDSTARVRRRRPGAASLSGERDSPDQGRW